MKFDYILILFDFAVSAAFDKNTMYIYNVYVVYVMSVMTISVEAYDTREKTVSVSGNSAHVYVPVEWARKKVKILLVEPLESNSQL